MCLIFKSNNKNHKHVSLSSTVPYPIRMRILVKHLHAIGGAWWYLTIQVSSWLMEHNTLKPQATHFSWDGGSVERCICNQVQHLSMFGVLYNMCHSALAIAFCCMPHVLNLALYMYGLSQPFPSWLFLHPWRHFDWYCILESQPDYILGMDSPLVLPTTQPPIVHGFFLTFFFCELIFTEIA